MKLTILGSTGSIGRQAIDIARFNNWEVESICANSSIDILEKQIRLLAPKYCAVFDEKAAKLLKKAVSDCSTKIFSGEDGICSMIRNCESDIVINSIVGVAGLLPTLAAIDSGKDIALANKETLVCAGEIVMKRALEKGVKIIPVDSEHSAIFQCLRSGSRSELRRILLTASGGPFFGKSREGLESITVDQALAHPTWSMGRKITVDCATLMNKGFEIIEAVHLFGVPQEKVEVVVHRESTIHSMVEFNDGCVIAQLGSPDMRTCIQYALTYPERHESPVAALDFTKIRSLTFAEPDNETFILLPLARWAINQGGVLPAVMNGANEKAVALFLEGKIKFTDIFDIVSKITTEFINIKSPSVDDILEAGAAAAGTAGALI